MAKDTNIKSVKQSRSARIVEKFYEESLEGEIKKEAS